MQATLQRGDLIAPRQFTLQRLALDHVTAATADVASFAYRVAGGVSLRQGMLQRCVRDVMTGTQHRIVSSQMLRECARELLVTGRGKDLDHLRADRASGAVATLRPELERMLIGSAVTGAFCATGQRISA